MALTTEDLQAIAGLLHPIKDDIQDLKDDMQVMKDDMQVMKDDMQVMKDDMQEINRRVKKVELTLENETNKSIQLLAENHINLVDKLNQAIKVQDKSILYEVQVSGLKFKLENLEREVMEIKKKLA